MRKVKEEEAPAPILPGEQTRQERDGVDVSAVEAPDTTPERVDSKPVVPRMCLSVNQMSWGPLSCLTTKDSQLLLSSEGGPLNITDTHLPSGYFGGKQPKRNSEDMSKTFMAANSHSRHAYP